MYEVTSVDRSSIGRIRYICRVRGEMFKAGEVTELRGGLGADRVFVCRDRYGIICDGSETARLLRQAVDHYKTWAND